MKNKKMYAIKYAKQNGVEHTVASTPLNEFDTARYNKLQRDIAYWAKFDAKGMLSDPNSENFQMLSKVLREFDQFYGHLRTHYLTDSEGEFTTSKYPNWEEERASWSPQERAEWDNS